MAQENLMEWVPQNCERVPVGGYFHIRDNTGNGGSWSIVTDNLVMVTCSGAVDGEEAKKRAIRLACALNRVLRDFPHGYSLSFPPENKEEIPT